MTKINVGAFIKAAEPEEHAFAKQFNLLRLPFQRKGTAYDFECPHSGKRYELKVDHAAARTGNHFLEVEYTNDGGTVWTDSGFALAVSQAQVYVVKVDSHYWFIDTDTLARALPFLDLRSVTTRSNVNGNRDGAYARGLLVPLTALRALAYEITPQE